MYLNSDDMKLGKYFKKLREDKEISLRSLDKLVSKSRLSRWESGQIELPWKDVQILLDKIGSSSSEFYYLISLDSHKNTYDVVKAYQANDIKRLEKEAKLSIEEWHQDNQNKNKFEKAIIACDYYMDLTGENLLNKQDINKLEKSLNDSICWYSQDIYLFSNSQLLISSSVLYRKSMSLIFSLNNVHYMYPIWNQAGYQCILNAIFALIKNHDLTRAKKLLKAFREIRLDGYHPLVQIRIKFLEKLFFFLDTGDDTELAKIFNDLKYYNLNELYDDLSLVFNQIKSIYAK